MNFFNYESGFMKFVTLLSRITVLNILWLCCCIPVITAGASTYAQYYSTKCFLNGDIHVFQNFKEGLRLEWKRATGTWVVLAVFCILFFIDYSLITANDLPYESALVVVSVLAFITLVMIMLWLFPVMINFKGTTKELLFNSFVFTFMYAPLTLIAIAFYAIALYLFLRFYLLRPLIILFGQGLIVYGILNLFDKAFAKYRTE